MMKQKSLLIESEIGRRIKASRINKKFTLEQMDPRTTMYVAQGIHGPSISD
jgi:hypothetical protein